MICTLQHFSEQWRECSHENQEYLSNLTLLAQYSALLLSSSTQYRKPSASLTMPQRSISISRRFSIYHYQHFLCKICRFWFHKVAFISTKHSSGLFHLTNDFHFILFLFFLHSIFVIKLFENFHLSIIIPVITCNRLNVHLLQTYYNIFFLKGARPSVFI